MPRRIGVGIFLWFDNDAYRLTEEMVMADDWIVVLVRFMQLLKTNTSNGRFFSIVIAKFVLLSDENDEMELVETNVVFFSTRRKDHFNDFPSLI